MPEELVQFHHWQASDLAQAGGKGRFACRAWAHDDYALYTCLRRQWGKFADINAGHM
jgi:hypothetical protein